jgi:Spy/CpxP family protein refolding chaperone
MRPGRGRGPWAELNLTDEQKAKAREIRQSYAEKIRAAEGREAKREVIQKMHEELKALLTEEQQATIQAHRQKMQAQRKQDMAKRHARIAKQLDMTEEQQAKAKAIRESYAEKIRAAEGRDAKAELVKEMHKELKGLLTEEQKAKAAEMWKNRRQGRRQEFMKALDLTDEQKAKGKAIRQSYREKIQAAETPQAKRELVRKMHQELKALLTEEQLEKLKDMPRPHGRRRPGRRDGKGGGPTAAEPAGDE